MKKKIKMSVELPAVSREDLRINSNDLDGEIARQPELIYHAGMAVALAISRRDATRDAIRQEEAALRLSTRKKADSRKDRMSETKLGEIVDQVEAMVSLRSLYTRRITQANEAEALYEAVKSRGYALRELAQFKLAQMAGSPFVGEAESHRKQMDRMRKPV